MNSKLVSYIVDCLNPTVNAQVGDMQRVPFVLPSRNIEDKIAEYAARNIEIKKELCLDHLTERISNQYPFINSKKIQKYIQNENQLLTQVLINEAIIN